MKIKLLLITLTMLNAYVTIAQPTIKWQNSYGGTQDEGFAFEAVFSIKPTADGGCIAVGDSKSNDGDVSGHHGLTTIPDIWVVKLDSLGTIDWQISLGGSSSDNTGALEVTADGGCIVIGTTSSIDGDITDTLGMSDIWVVKLDNTGTIQWQKPYGGTSYEVGWSIKQTSDGGFVFAGNTNSVDGDITFNHGGEEIWVVKTDSVGTIQWQKCYGGSDFENAAAINLTNDGGYIVAGNTGSADGDVIGNTDTSSAGFLNGQAWVVKLDSIGGIDWQITYGGNSSATNPFELDWARSVVQANNGEYIVGGATTSSTFPVMGQNGYQDYWLFKLTSTGSVLWQSCLGGSSVEEGGKTEQTPDGGFISFGHSGSNDSLVTGNHGSDDYWLAKTDSNGIFQWGQCYGGPGAEKFPAMCQTADGGFFLVGQSTSNSGQVSGHHGALNVPDMWVVRLSAPTVGIKENNGSLSQLNVFPNPAYSIARISFQLEKTESVAISIYDITGREIENLYSGKLSAGSNNLEWQIGKKIENGIYFVRIEGDGFLQSKKISVVR